MKTTVLFIALSLFCFATSVSSEDILIDINGNLEVGTTNPDGRLEVIGDADRYGIVGSSSGTGIGLYGENTSASTYGYVGHYNYGLFGYSEYGVGVYGYSTSGYAGYFLGDARVTGDLTIDGILTGASIGDITSVNPGTGLTGGGATGDVTLHITYAGTGAAGTAARSDHDHDSAYSPTGHTHSGADITSGTVNEGRIDSAIARDSEIMTTVLNNDGDGSGVDADTLDGNHLSEITGAYAALEARLNALETALCQDAYYEYYAYYGTNPQYKYNLRTYCDYRYYGYYGYYGTNGINLEQKNVYKNLYVRVIDWFDDILPN